MLTCNLDRCRRQNDDLESHTFYAQYGDSFYHLACAWTARQQNLQKDGWNVKTHRAIHKSGLEIAVTELYAKEEYHFEIKAGRSDSEASYERYDPVQENDTIGS